MEVRTAFPRPTGGVFSAVSVGQDPKLPPSAGKFIELGAPGCSWTIISEVSS